MKHFFTAFLIAFVLLTASPHALAAAFPDYLSKWFPTIFKQKDTGPDPTDTLQAPFMDPPPMDAGKEIGVPYKSLDVESSLQLFKPHRQANQVGGWMSAVVSQTLNFSYDTYPKQIVYVQQYYSTKGYNELQEFLKTTNILGTLKSKNWKVSSFAQEQPILRNEGEVADRYRWLFQIPVMLSFFPNESVDYEDGNDNAYKSEELMFTIQVGRIKPSPGNEIGLAIESWSLARSRR